jgi:hypothetical protein
MDAPHIWIPGIDDLKKHTEENYGDAKHERHAHGVITVNGQEVATTLQCPHCMGHFISRKGSGHRRTFCMKCMAVTCGKIECDPCRPFVAELGLSQGREM